MESVSFYLVPYRWVYGGGDGEEEKKRQGRERKDGELRTPVLSYELKQAVALNLAIKVFLKQLHVPSSSLSLSPSTF